MSFRFIQPAASGNLQYLISRKIENPDILDFTDTPSDGLTWIFDAGAIPPVIAGSAKSILFDGFDDHLMLPTTEGLGTEFLLEDIGFHSVKHGSSANNIMFETWLKLSNSNTGNTNDFFEATIQRNSVSSTVGFDGIYTSRVVYGSSGGVGDPDFLTSGHFIDFQYASGSDMAWSLTSAFSIISEEWNHIVTSYTSGETGAKSNMKIWVNGLLDREQTLNELTELALEGETNALPATAAPLIARNSISFGGRLDEMRMWLNSGTPESHNVLASVSSLGLVPEYLNNETQLDFAPSADYMAAWWRFESVSAIDLLSNLPDSIIDTTQYLHTATPINFTGTLDFSEEQSIIYGVSASGDLTSLKGGTVDHGGMLLFDNIDGTMTSEEGTENLIKESFNIWSASGDAVVNPDNLQIYTGSSAVRVNTNSSGGGAKHIFDYNLENIYDRNTYTCSMRLLGSTGSATARICFIMGDAGNSATTTAVMDRNIWKPFYIRNTVSANINETTITGSVTVQQLYQKETGGVDNDIGSLFNIDSLSIHEGDAPSHFVAPDEIRKSGQIYWDIGD